MMSVRELKVAIVGAGPAGLYAASQLLDQHDIGVTVDLIDRLPTPFGLVRAGVAPDHAEKKLVIDRLFDYYLGHPKVRFFGNIEIGKDITHDELKSHYDGVIYAVGSGADAALSIPGETITGSHSARDFVGWYNGHPDFRELSFDLSCKRAVIIGNGNVALDVARILTLPTETLSRTEIADHALDALRKNAIEEVVILGRRGPEYAAFNNPEIEEFEHLEGVDVVIEGAPIGEPDIGTDWNTARKLKLLKRLSQTPQKGGGKRIVLRFNTSPSAILGGAAVTGLKTRSTSGDNAESEIETGLVLRSVGYRGVRLPGLPFDDATHVIPNIGGRVMDGANAVPGCYVTGWIKRGPRGVIGSNKKCAAETAKSLLEDAKAGRLDPPERSDQDPAKVLSEGKADVVTAEQWKRIDQAERAQGYTQGRPRVKISSWAKLLETAAR